MGRPGELLAGDDERLLFTFLGDIDPVFTLRFQDGSTVEVTLTRTSDRQFTLTEYTPPVSREAGRSTGP